MFSRVADVSLVCMFSRVADVSLVCVFFRVGADITVLREREVDYDSDTPIPRKIAEVLVRKVPDDQQVWFPFDKFE